MIVSCAIGGVTAFCAIRVPVMIRVLVIRNASTNIGFELVISCSLMTTTPVGSPSASTVRSAARSI